MTREIIGYERNSMSMMIRMKIIYILLLHDQKKLTNNRELHLIKRMSEREGGGLPNNISYHNRTAV